MALALYRKYRPQTFAEITGQHHVKITLSNQIATGKLGHAYLFTGPRGVGKTTTARILAKAVNCEARKDGASEPCNACAACSAITEGRAIDVVEIDAASNTGVDNVRENIIENTRFTPVALRMKVFIIDEVHMLSTAAFNALLKTLEEPPAHVFFVMATTELHKVPQTIISRCQRFDLKRIAVPDLVARLSHLVAGEGRKVAPSVLLTVARGAGGSLRDAESSLEQILAVTDGVVGDDEASLVLPRSDLGIALEYVEALFTSDPGRALAVVARVQEESIDPLRCLDDTVNLLRRIMLSALERDESALAGEYDAEMEKAVARLAKNGSVSRTAAMIDRLLRARQDLKLYDAGLLPLELAAVEITGEVPLRDKDFIGQRDPAEGGSGTRKLEVVRSPIEAPPGPKASNFQLPTSKPARRKGASVVKTTIETVRSEWQAFIKAVGEMNHSLPFILNVSAPIRIEDGSLIVGSRYPFHCDRLNDQKHDAVLRAACEQVFGEDLPVFAEVSDVAPLDSPGDVAPLTEPVQTDPALKAVLDALGGKVVE